MPIVLIPKESTVVAGGAVGFSVQVTAAKPGPMTLALKGPRGKPLPQERAIVIDADGRGAATFEAVRFAATALTTTAITCTVTGRPEAAVATVTIVPSAAEGPIARSFEEWPVAAEIAIVEKPAARKPIAKKPIAKQPAAKQPAAKKHIAKQPAAKQPIAKQPPAKLRKKRGAR